ncbi:MAG TPA: DUF3604 domain-containing protein [Kineosporiaceae bacterium]|nr:DUF3604 domain-containing protein [Kineosporiaceae bacterium]
MSEAGTAEHSHGHSAGHRHARMCGGVDHNSGSYTPQQRADLDRVLDFNRRMAEKIDAGVDVAGTEAFLDPDPLRYMWVDEGQGRIEEVITKAHQILDSAPALPGHTRLSAVALPGSHRASRPSVSAGPDGTRLTTWIEWVPDQGDVVQALVERAGPEFASFGSPVTVSVGVRDVFRPTALVTEHGVPWVFYGSSLDGVVAVLATRLTAAGWSEPAVVSTSAAPSFNQEVTAHADGSLELCWQGRNGDSFGIWSRRWDGEWQGATLVSTGAETNVWDPAVTAFADGSSAYAWSEYAGGAYRVVVRRRYADGTFGEPRPVTSGRDYALHPHLAVTTDQRLWCAFDVITVAGHGGSGPTKLRPAADLLAYSDDDRSTIEGMRAAGDSVPPELLPEVTASIRVVQLGDRVVEAPGELAGHLNVVPSGLPRLIATPDNGLSVVYRIHRRLPLMTYYWEVAVQSLTTEGWAPASTVRGTDGTLEEAAVTGSADGVLIVAQTDGRLAHALEWTEGFGGRECPYLLEHQGSVIWHGIHGVGVIVATRIGLPGPALELPADSGHSVLHADERVESRRWYPATLDPHTDADGLANDRRYVAELEGRSYTLYWGDLHRHSLVSRCTAGDEPSLEDFYRYAWDVCEYDFWAVTDHSENSTDYQWWSIQKMADLFHLPGTFVPFYGFEWTSADHGHQNVIYGDVARGAPIFSAFADGSTDPAGLWAGLEKHPDYPAITIPHHPGSAMVHNDWDYFDPRYSTLVEIFQACRGNYEGPGAFRQYSDAIVDGTFTIDGLMRGHKFGLIASSDHGHGASYVGAFAESLDRASVFEALQNRRTFAATTRDVVVDVRLGAAFLGEDVLLAGPRTFAIHAQGYTELARVDIVRNGTVVHVERPALDLPDGWVELAIRLEWGGCDQTTVWDGALTIAGGAIVQTPFVCPEITAVTANEVVWRNTTHSFGELYGAQRGGIDVSVTGPPDAVISVRSGERRLELTLGALMAAPLQEIPSPLGHFRLQPGIGGLSTLGTDRLDLSWTDDSLEPAFYYVRVFQVDGEMAWSSPIWVTTSGTGAPV